MILRRLVAVVVLAAAAALATGCAPEPAPSPTAPVFATETEAFAAAEATYRAYVDALNQVDLSDPTTFEAVFAWTTGDLNAADRKGLTGYFAEGMVLTGQSSVLLIEPLSFDSKTVVVTLAGCLDVREIDVLNAVGDSVVESDRTDVQSLTITTRFDPTSPSSMLISEIGPRDGDPQCL